MGTIYKYAGKNPQSCRKPGSDTQFTLLAAALSAALYAIRYSKRPLLQFLSFMYFALKL